MKEPQETSDRSSQSPALDEDTDQKSCSDEDNFSLHEYDLDVVDDALMNPNGTQYLDHFGFTIQVKTDDEYDDDTSDSDSDFDEDSKPAAKQQAGNNARFSGENAHKKFATSLSDDDNISIDTAMTTPIALKNQQLNNLPLPPVLHENTTNTTSPAETPKIRTRGRSTTVSNVVPTLKTPPQASVIQEAIVEDQQSFDKQRAEAQQLYGAIDKAINDSAPVQQETASHHNSGRRKRSATVSKPESPIKLSNTTVPETVFEENDESEDSLSDPVPAKSDSRPKSNSSSRSFSPFNVFRQSGSSPNSSRSSLSSSTTGNKVERPSQTFRERQSKRISTMYKGQTPGHRLSQSSTTYYEMLMSKFGRSSHESQHESSRHADLKDEALDQLEILKESSSTDAYNWDFWAHAISDFDKMAQKRTGELRENLCKGIPPSLRGMMWQIISKSRAYGDLDTQYKSMLSRTSLHEKAIERDLARTFPNHPFFQGRDSDGQQALFNVVKAYSLFDQDVGYCQGIAFVAGCLLLHMPEEDAFCCLVRLMECYGLRGHYTQHMEALSEHMYQFDNLLQQRFPEVHRHLEIQGVKPSMYVSQWFLTLYAYRCPLNIVYRVFDLLFAEGIHIILQVALAFISHHQKTILGLTFEHLLSFFRDKIFDTYEHDEEKLVHDTFSMDIPPQLLLRLAKHFATESAREARTQSQEDHLRKVNADLSEHVHRLETAYRSLETEHQEVTQQAIETKMSMARMNDENQQLRRQLAQVRSDFDDMKAQMTASFQAELDKLNQKNVHLSERNGALENQLADIESVLISLKVNFAEREGEYEVMKRQLHDAQKAST
ncbi:GTPase-activating protein [Apophysomyces ossiformis]|uniref:GTPase-activating protein n=1 Tax=Apophysomyces ossiformis TaxID=679940 RepID=A0A8H7EPU1_9FUNG|nr:GTPase-activating protein [Apophysomyces ossiformis]KAF7727547.1 GTPase-activating protein [Apophysomyces ossiformis]